MKNILVPVPEHGDMKSVLDGVTAFARRFASTVEGFALAPDLSRTIAAEFPIDPHYIDPGNRRELVAGARQNFENYMKSAGIAPADAGLSDPSDTVGWRFLDAELLEDARAASYARIFDVVALSRPEKGGAGTKLATAETMLFESGRPVLILPPEPRKTVASTVVIAWNGSLETARAISHAMGVLLKADKVFVLALEGWQIDGPRASEQVTALKRHGIDVELVVRQLDSGPGETLLKEAEALGGDLIVKGAYTQSRLRQMIFGGATSYLLSQTRIPMLIAH